MKFNSKYSMARFIIIIIMTIGFANFISGCKKKEEIPPKSSSIVRTLDSVDKKEYLIVKISNIKELKGELKIALYNNKDSFDKQENPVATKQITVNQYTIEVKFDNLLPGNGYALAVYHDANQNGKLDTNFLGIPKEGFCFSNNAMGSFGPPSYEDCTFEIKPGTFVIQELKLIFL